MRITKLILIPFSWSLMNYCVNAQDLIKTKLTTKDKKDKVMNVYEYNATGHYGVIKLTLYQNGGFYFKLNGFMQDVFSEGKWIKKKDTLILKSNITNGHIPIKLTYSHDTSNLINGFKVGIVRNLKGKYLPDGLVNINNDSIKCVPENGFCIADYKSIDSIKIVFENGLSSEWLKVIKKDYGQVIPIVQTNFLISSYTTFENSKYQILKSSLKPIEKGQL